jgi:hypothetical protein
MAVANASWGSFFDALVEPSSRTLAASVGGTSIDVLTRLQELLGQQLAQPPSGLDCPGPLRAQRFRPGQQPRGLAPVSHQPQPGERPLVAVDRHRRLRRRVRVDTDDHRHRRPSSWTRVSVTTDTPDEGAARLFRATP